MVESHYYEILGVSKAVNADEVKRAFRKAALRIHPDQGGKEEDFKELKIAFEYVLKDILRAKPYIEWSESKVSFGSYDPFTDPDYQSYSFFEAQNNTIAQFERSILAENCTHCHGLAVKTKLVDPTKGFLGREERFCICQRIK